MPYLNDANNNKIHLTINATLFGLKIMPVDLLNKGTDSTPQNPADACTETTSGIFFNRISVILNKSSRTRPKCC